MESSGSKVIRLLEIVQQAANDRPALFDVKGAGSGDLDTNAFMADVRDRAIKVLGDDFSEKRICGDSHLAVDFYIPAEATIVEIALGLKHPNSEFEKDILKALMAQQEQNWVNRLVLIGKPGAVKQCSQPGRRAFMDWAKDKHNVVIDVYDIKNNVGVVAES